MNSSTFTYEPKALSVVCTSLPVKGTSIVRWRRGLYLAGTKRAVDSSRHHVPAASLLLSLEALNPSPFSLHDGFLSDQIVKKFSDN